MEPGRGSVPGRPGHVTVGEGPNRDFDEGRFRMGSGWAGVSSGPAAA